MGYTNFVDSKGLVSMKLICDRKHTEIAEVNRWGVLK